jgi:outer membrane receptor for ferrienterochelin and colicins
VISALSHAAYAAEGEELELYGGEEFVVTATKTKLEAKEVPMAVEVVTQKQIKELGAYSVQDALRLGANIDVQDAGMTGNQVMLRGNSSMHTLILVDGKRVAAENSSSAINAYTLKRINIADVERIEVIRGNGSALYGSDALGGVVNIITKSPTKPSMSVDAHTGSKDEALNFSYSSGKEGKLSLKLGGGIEKIRKTYIGPYDTYSSYAGKKTSVADTTNMYGTRRSLNGTVQYDFDDKHNLALDMNFMREQLKTQGNDTYGSDYVNGTSPYPMLKDYSYDNNRSDYALTFNGEDGKHNYKLRTYFSELRKENNTKYMNKTTGTWKQIDFDKNNYKSFVAEGMDSYKADERNTLTYGVEYKKDYMDGTFAGSNGGSGTASYGGITKAASEVSAESEAFYLQDELRLGEKLMLFPAIRVDHHETFGTHASPKLGATYNLSDNARVKVNWGKGFRAPTLYELYSEMAKSGMMPMTVNVLGNKDLDPEKSTNFDIGVEVEQGKSTAKLSYFHNKINNLIDMDYLGMRAGGLYYQYANVDKAKISGVETELGYNFDKNWGMKLSYNYIEAKNAETGERLANRARQSGVVQLNYTDAKENPLTVSLYNRFYIDYRANDNESSAITPYRNDYTYGLTGLVVSKQMNKNLRIYGGVDNIFDKKFHYDTFNTYYIDGRTWRLGAEMTF